MIINNIVVYDFETGSANKLKCQPLQLAAIIIDVKRLEIISDSVFNSLISYMDDEEAIKMGLDPIQSGALEKNRLDKQELKKAPSVGEVWKMYTEYLKNYNTKGVNGGEWSAPVRAGFNIINFDDEICKRLCNKYGPALSAEGNMTIYHPVTIIDAQQLMSTMFNYHRMSKNNSTSMDTIREYMGYKTEGAHNALIDVQQIADLIIRFFRLNRNLIDGKLNLPLGKKIKFKGCVDGKI